MGIVVASRSELFAAEAKCNSATLIGVPLEVERPRRRVSFAGCNRVQTSSERLLGNEEKMAFLLFDVVTDQASSEQERNKWNIYEDAAKIRSALVTHFVRAPRGEHKYDGRLVY